MGHKGHISTKVGSSKNINSEVSPIGGGISNPLF
jgi:hypothetical protein